MTLPNTFGRTDVVVHIAKAINAKRYLEIGCRDDECFQFVRKVVPESVGIDPIMGGTHRIESDRYFEKLEADASDVYFDLIFIDGDHRHPQVAKDIDNSLEYLSPDGVIVMHDVWPFAPHMEHESYSGTVWRAFVKHARTKPNVEAFSCIVPGDPVGVGLLRLRTNTHLLSVSDIPEMDEMNLDMMFDHENVWSRRMPYLQACARLGIPAP